MQMNDSQRIPAPKDRGSDQLQALIIDSWFDNYVGVVMLVRVVDGRVAKGDRIKLMATDATYEANQLGVFTPANQPRESLEAGEVGFIIAGIKELQAAKVGDTVTLVKAGTGGAAFTATEPLPGFKEIQPQVFAQVVARREARPGAADDEQTCAFFLPEQLPDGEFLPAMPLNCGEELIAGRARNLFDGRRRIIPGRVANLTRADD